MTNSTSMIANKTNVIRKVGLSYADCERINVAAETGNLHCVKIGNVPAKVKRGQIYIADLGEGVGSEQQGVRPVLVIQNDVGNSHSKTVLIVPITSASKRDLPTHMKLHRGTGGLNKESTLIIEQMRTIDKGRLKNYIGNLSSDLMTEVNSKIMIQVGIS